MEQVAASCFQRDTARWNRRTLTREPLEEESNTQDRIAESSGAETDDVAAKWNKNSADPAEEDMTRFAGTAVAQQKVC